jgi:hypothetical protein
MSDSEPDEPELAHSCKGCLKLFRTPAEVKNHVKKEHQAVACVTHPISNGMLLRFKSVDTLIVFRTAKIG